MIVKFFPLIILLFLASCGGEKAGSPRKLEVSFGALSTTGTPMLVFISNANGSIRHTRKIDDGKTSMTLANGVWNFYAIAWDGSTIDSFDGTPKCGFSQINLVDSTNDINLKISPADCTTSNFFGTYNWEGSSTAPNFYGARISFCPFVATTTELTSSGFCSASSGSFSFKIIFPEVTNNIVTGEGIESECYNFPAAPTSFFSTAAKIPLGLGANSPFYTQVRTYPGSTTCSGTAQDIPFANGLAPGSSITRSFSPEDGTIKTIKIVQLPGKRATVEFANNNVPYAENVCRPFTVKLKNGDGGVVVSATDVDISMSCMGNCEAYFDSACTSAVSTTIFPKETASKVFYMKTSNIESTLYVTPYGSTIYSGAIEKFRQRLTYNDITMALLENHPNLSDISAFSLSSDPVIAGSNYIYKTSEGRYGKMRITSYTPNNITFDYDTFGAFANNGIVFTSCAQCSIDLDVSSPVSTTYSSNTEANYIATGSDGAFLPYGSIQFFKVPLF